MVLMGVVVVVVVVWEVVMVGGGGWDGLGVGLGGGVWLVVLDCIVIWCWKVILFFCRGWVELVGIGLLVGLGVCWCFWFFLFLGVFFFCLYFWCKLKLDMFIFFVFLLFFIDLLCLESWWVLRFILDLNIINFFFRYFWLL